MNRIGARYGSWSPILSILFIHVGSRPSSYSPAAFCARAGYDWPETRGDASDLLGELRREIGHPRPELEDSPLRARRPKRARYAEWELHREIADAFTIRR